ncbi:hypothetical protein [Curtobacterium sp. MCBD17_040]|uniref:hypothetical protein n=1 Tax=Curtobacterium sp. MCBD17_040 TaxID=2175674 RepID=UPI0021AD4AF6|nr:hypothetical protein [Curtobacterium sp. MCBD17_040]WIB63354.1 hypothetical protein DEI94_14585 [Curtobacterium sp. MCBD17_040]
MSNADHRSDTVDRSDPDRQYENAIGERLGDPVWARVRPLVFRTIIGAVVAAGLVGVVAVLIGDFGLVAIQLLLTITVVIVFALLSWYDADVSAKRSGAFAMASVATSMYLLVAGLLEVWVLHDGPYGADVSTVGEQFWQWIGAVLIARAALLHVHLLLVIHRRYPTPLLQVVAKATVVVIAVIAVLLSIPVLFSHTHFASGYWRLVWVLAILDLLGTVLVPLSNALFRPRADDPYSLTTDGGGAAPMQSADRSAWGVPGGAVTPVSPVGTSDADRAARSVQAPVPNLPTGWDSVPAPVVPEQIAPDSSTNAAGSSSIGAGTRVPAVVRGRDGLRYAAAPPVERVLAWPRYVDGTPLPALPDGSPDFSQVARA